MMITSKEVRKSLKEWEPMSGQTISARFKCQNTTIIQVYAPTNEAEEEVKQEFYHQLHTAFIKMKKRNLIVIIGYVNAEVWGRSMRMAKCSVHQMNLEYGKHSSHIRNLKSSHGDLLIGPLRTRMAMWL